MRIFLAVTAFLMVAGTAQAQHNTGAAYVNLGYGFHSGEIAEVGEVDTGGIVFRSGYDFSQYMGFEAEGFVGLDDEGISATVPAGTFTLDAKVRYSATAFFLGRYPVGETGSSVLVRLGYGQTEYDLSNPMLDGASTAFVSSVTNDGFAYGIGGEWLIHGLNGIRADYTSYNNGKEDVFAISWVTRF